MTLREARCTFTQMLSMLIQHAIELGYECNLDCVRCYKEGHHMSDSLHYIGLAADVNLLKAGVWIKDETGHKELHEYWKTIGGADPIPGDFNHYSIFWNGVR